MAPIYVNKYEGIYCYKQKNYTIVYYKTFFKLDYKKYIPMHDTTPKIVHFMKLKPLTSEK